MSGLSNILDEAALATVPDVHGLAIPEFVAAYQAIKSGEGGEVRSVEFLSAYPQEGAAKVALGMSLVASQILGKRILLIDGSAGDDPGLAKITAAIQTPLNLAAADTIGSAVVRSRSGALWFATLAPSGNQKVPSALPTNMEGAGSWIRGLRDSFDLIIVAASPSSKTALGLVMAKMVDAVVLVVEAERTRAPVVRQLQSHLHSVGRDPCGAILTNRQYYIPRWLYRWL